MKKHTDFARCRDSRSQLNLPPCKHPSEVALISRRPLIVIKYGLVVAVTSHADHVEDIVVDVVQENIIKASNTLLHTLEMSTIPSKELRRFKFQLNTVGPCAILRFQLHHHRAEYHTI